MGEFLLHFTLIMGDDVFSLQDIKSSSLISCKNKTSCDKHTLMGSQKGQKVCMAAAF